MVGVTCLPAALSYRRRARSRRRVAVICMPNLAIAASRTAATIKTDAFRI
jgi:hypothetical protein